MEIVGYFAAILTTMAFVPQVYKIYKTNNVEGLSFHTYILFNVGVFLWLLYGISLMSFPMIFANGITLSLSLYILYKIKKNIR